MTIATRKSRKGFTLVELLVVIAIIVALAALATPQIFKALKRAALAEAISNARQVKIALDNFASDYNGVFPSDDTAEDVAEGLAGGQSSNDFLRQLHMAGIADSEVIFWVKNSPVANKRPPDNKVKEGKRPQKSEILKPGDCHWAYVVDHDNTDSGTLPILLDPYTPGTSDFDEDLWEWKAIVMTLDGSVKALRMRTSDSQVLDGNKKPIMSSQASAWEGSSGQDPTTRLKQPQARAGG